MVRVGNSETINTTHSMKETPIQTYTRLRDEIFAEREAIVNRLREIDAALGSSGFGRPMTPRLRIGTGHARNDKSLRETVLELLGGGAAMNKHELLDRILKSGYQFSTDDPLNSLGVILYGKNPKFKNDHGKFSLPS